MRIIPTIAIVVALAAPAPAAHAQPAFGLWGGPAVPGDDLEGLDGGLQGGVALDIGLPLSRLGARADLGLQQLSGPEGNLYQANAAASARADLLSVPRFAVYAIAGGGPYYIISDDLAEIMTAEVTGEDPDDLIWGVHGGVGMSLSTIRLRPFIEARYHRMLGDAGSWSFVPVSVGLFF